MEVAGKGKGFLVKELGSLIATPAHLGLPHGSWVWCPNLAFPEEFGKSPGLAP